VRHPAWQFAAAALHVIMQLVRVEDCARRIFASPNALAATLFITISITSIATRMLTSVAYHNELSVAANVPNASVAAPLGEVARPTGPAAMAQAVMM
jgi:hypothetical protein